jgi:hypothetical protein
MIVQRTRAHGISFSFSFSLDRSLSLSSSDLSLKFRSPEKMTGGGATVFFGELSPETN